MNTVEFFQKLPRAHTYVLSGDPCFASLALEVIKREFSDRTPVRFDPSGPIERGFTSDLILGMVDVEKASKTLLQRKHDFPLVIRAQKSSIQDVQGEVSSVVFQTPKNLKARRALLDALVVQFDLKLYPETLRVVLPRVYTGEEFRDALNLLRALPERSRNDLELVQRLIPEKHYPVEWLFLHRRIATLLFEARRQPALIFLGRLHSTLCKVYFWLERGQDEEAFIEALGINYKDIGVWRALDRTYPPRGIREALEEVSECYKLAMIGDDLSWRIRLVNVLTKIGA